MDDSRSNYYAAAASTSSTADFVARFEDFFGKSLAARAQLDAATAAKQMSNAVTAHANQHGLFTAGGIRVDAKLQFLVAPGASALPLVWTIHVNMRCIHVH